MPDWNIHSSILKSGWKDGRHLQTQRLEVITRLEGSGIRRTCDLETQTNVQLPIFMPPIHTANLKISFKQCYKYIFQVIRQSNISLFFLIKLNN